MRPDPRFVKQPKSFWAHVRTVGQHLGYVIRKSQQIKIPSVAEMRQALTELGLDPDPLGTSQAPSALGAKLTDYFTYRARVLEDFVEPRLMDAKEAKRLFKTLSGKLKPTCPIPMNKQKGKKKAPAYLTGMVNMLVEQNAKGLPCDYDPRELTTVTRNDAPLRTLARRIVDAHYTWWMCGRSYLCRIVDMLHMGYVDEVLFGREVVDRLPLLVRDWCRDLDERHSVR